MHTVECNSSCVGKFEGLKLLELFAVEFGVRCWIASLSSGSGQRVAENIKAGAGS